MRGATQWYCRTAHPDYISIHTPHAGSDKEPATGKTKHRTFQSTLPMRGATVTSIVACVCRNISIHTPHAGSDTVFSLMFTGWVISIHTPHAGSDDISWTLRKTQADFNPHSPCGERRYGIRCTAWGRTISIHTPHAGSDLSKAGFTHWLRLFQSTLPMRGATRISLWALLPERYFNPHSPCGERPDIPSTKLQKMAFQSTLPMRGATLSGVALRWALTYFNPHSPCGERPFPYSS